VDRPAVPPWFAEVVIITQHLATKGLLEAFAQQIRLVRGCFGRYEPIDFLALLLGYAISGERTLSEFFDSLNPFQTAFMALFGRRDLPHRSSLSRFLATVDRPCLEAFRTLFQQQSFTEGWTAETIGGIFDRQGRRNLVFDVDATRQAARQRALPCDPALPAARRRFEAVCAPGYKGRKRGEVVRTRTTALQMHTRQWIGTYGNRGNGDYQGELAAVLQAIKTYLAHFALPTEAALLRLDGQYGDAVVIAQLIEAGVNLLTRGRTYRMLERPQLQRVLAHPPSARVTALNTGEVVELFDGGWLPLDEGLPQVRVIVARHAAPPPGKKVMVGKRVGEWVYELFITTLPIDGFLVEDALDLYHGRGAFEAVLSDLRCGRGSRSLVLVHRVWPGTVANCVPMGMESASLAWEKDTGRGITQDRMGTTQRSDAPLADSRTHTRRVWSVAIGWRPRPSPWSIFRRGLCVARGRQAALSCWSQPVVE
jgi:hypothetical protein